MGIEIQWPLVLFSLFMGVVGGMMVFSGIACLAGKASTKTRFAADVAIMVLLVIGGCFSLLHLASPGNVMAALTNIFSFSGISVELMLLGVCFIIALVEAILLKREPSAAVLKILAILGIVFGVLLAFFTGHGYMMDARPLWDTYVLPFAYLGSGLAAGSFVFAVVQLIAKDGAESVLGLKAIYLIMGIVGAVTVASYAVSLGSGIAVSSGLLFWGGLIMCGVVGVVVSAVWLFVKGSDSNVRTIVVIGLAVAIIAALCVRMIMWAAGAGFLNLFELAATGGPVF